MEIASTFILTEKRLNSETRSIKPCENYLLHANNYVCNNERSDTETNKELDESVLIILCAICMHRCNFFSF